MSVAFDEVHSSIEELRLAGILCRNRVITCTDDLALAPGQANRIGTLKQRRASGAARIVARELLANFGQAHAPLPRSPSGAPVWPDGIVGSMAHDPWIATAAVARCRDVAVLGVDIELSVQLDSDLAEIVLTESERKRIADDPFRGMLFFVAKEAVYKAVHPTDHEFLEHHDVEIDLKHCKAITRNGRTLDLRFAISSHVVAVAFARTFSSRD
jgi:4'-phosphopantetheinyl transferase EntD